MPQGYPQLLGNTMDVASGAAAVATTFSTLSHLSSEREKGHDNSHSPSDRRWYDVTKGAQDSGGDYKRQVLPL
jgi:hypothetical protein